MQLLDESAELGRWSDLEWHVFLVASETKGSRILSLNNLLTTSENLQAPASSPRKTRFCTSNYFINTDLIDLPVDGISLSGSI